MKHNVVLPIAILLGISLVSCGFALDLGVAVANQTLTLGTYQDCTSGCSYLHLSGELLA